MDKSSSYNAKEKAIYYLKKMKKESTPSFGSGTLGELVREELYKMTEEDI